MKALLLLLFTALVYGQPTNDTDYAFLIEKIDSTYLGNGFFQHTAKGKQLMFLCYDESNNPVNPNAFSGLIDHTKNIPAFSLTDSTITAKLYYRKNFGTLDKPKKAALSVFLHGITGSPTDTAAITMIHFYSGIQGWPPNLYGEKPQEKTYTKKMPKGTRINHYYVYQKRFGPDDKHAKKYGWLYDKHGFIEHMFIPAHFNYNTTITLMPDGRYYTYFGEHGPEQVREGLKVLLGTDK